MDSKDFNNIGKRMPYHTPEGFFDTLEDNIWQEVKTDFQEKKDTEKKPVERKKIRLSVVMRSALAVAASIALVVVVSVKLYKPADTSFSEVDQAFSQLTTDDQAYLLNVYQEDIFINE